MESLIHHFIIVTHGVPGFPWGKCTRVPKCQGRARFLHREQTGRPPYRMKIRSPSFVNMGAFDHMARGYLISDVVTIFGTYDVVMGECDR